MRATGRRITFCGHMHEPMLFNLSATGKVGAFVPISGVQIPLLPPRHWLAIPGAVGQPRDGDPAACYAIYDDACTAIIFWRVPYDHEAASAKIRAAGLPLSLASRLADGQ
jgi:diadenosine tetraphosphatase ApaH/serine/threonine PP2A family protein phosphatase